MPFSLQDRARILAATGRQSSVTSARVGKEHEGSSAVPDSATADSFGASVAIATDRSERGLYLVVGNQEAAVAIRSAGGQVVTNIGGGRYLAVMDLTTAAAVKRRRGIRLCGAITVDQARFSTFLAAAGLQSYS